MAIYIYHFAIYIIKYLINVSENGGNIWNDFYFKSQYNDNCVY